jgi:hypothetical protein
MYWPSQTPSQNEHAKERRITPNSRNQRLNNIRSPPKPGKATNLRIARIEMGRKR